MFLWEVGLLHRTSASLYSTFHLLSLLFLPPRLIIDIASSVYGIWWGSEIMIRFFEHTRALSPSSKTVSACVFLPLSLFGFFQLLLAAAAAIPLTEESTGKGLCFVGQKLSHSGTTFEILFP